MKRISHVDGVSSLRLIDNSDCAEFRLCQFTHSKRRYCNTEGFETPDIVAIGTWHLALGTWHLIHNYFTNSMKI